MFRPGHSLIVAALIIAASPSTARTQHSQSLRAISCSGEGQQTVVLLSGLVGGVAGFRRLEARLLSHHQRVVIIDSYLLSIDSADVSFAAQARRVDRKLYFLDVGALADHRSPIFSGSLRLVPFLTKLPGGRGLVRRRLVRGLHESSGPNAWLDAAAERAYTEPLLDQIAKAVALAIRLGGADEPEPLAAVIDRVRVPITVLLGGAPHTAGPVAGELSALDPLGGLLRVETMAGVGHFPHEEAPDELARRLLEARREVVVAAPRGVR